MDQQLDQVGPILIKIIYSTSTTCYILRNNDHLPFFNSALGERHTFDCRANQISTVVKYNYVTQLNYYHWQHRYVKIEMQLKLRQLSKTPLDGCTLPSTRIFTSADSLK